MTTAQQRLRKLIEENPAHRYELIYSPDDSGWYWMDWLTDQASPVYPTEKKARSVDLTEVRWD